MSLLTKLATHKFWQTRFGRLRLTSTDALLILVVIMWGSNFSVIKVGLADFPPLLFTTLRFVVVVLIMIALTKSTGHSLRVERGHWWWIIGLGLLGNTVYQYLFIFGVAQTTANNASLILATTPIFIALIGSLFGFERVAMWGWVGIILSLLGIVVIVTGSDTGAVLEFGGPSLIGNFLVFLAALAWAAFTVFMRPVTKHYSAITVTTLATTAGTIPLLLLALPSLVATDLQSIPLRSWLALLTSATIGIVIPYFIWNYGVQQLGSTRTGVYSNLIPGVALIVAWFWLGETLTWIQFLGGVLALAGVILARPFLKSVR